MIGVQWEWILIPKNWEIKGKKKGRKEEREEGKGGAVEEGNEEEDEEEEEKRKKEEERKEGRSWGREGKKQKNQINIFYILAL